MSRRGFWLRVLRRPARDGLRVDVDAIAVGAHQAERFAAAETATKAGTATADQARSEEPQGDGAAAQQRSDEPEAAAGRRAFGRFPLVAAVVGLGLMICSVTEALSRATLAPSSWFLWAGIAVIVAPIVYRLCSEEATVWERVALVCMLGLALYAVKLMRDPFGFTMPDEFFHAHNAQQIGSRHKLFGTDSMLPITTKYPGLGGATSALMSMTGMSSFGAGLIVIGAARLTMMLGLFALFGAISGSWRIAGLGAAAYAGNSNFTLWGAQFAYESLALPLLVVVLAAIAERARARRIEWRAWAVPIVLGIAAIVLTHHLTAYLLVVVLIGLAAAPLLAPRRITVLDLWPFALLALALTVIWLVVVASATVGYLSPVLTHAFTDTLNTVLGESSPRALFHSGPEGLGTPIAQRIVAYAELGILLVALPFGLLAVWRRHQRNPLALGLCLAALGFFAVLALRFSPSAWEVANRLGEFLFVGLAFVVAYALVDRVLSGRPRSFAPALVAGSLAVVVVGGAITGWPSNATLAAPVRVVAGGHQIESETLAAGRWVGAHLARAGFAAPEADARTILLYGRRRVLSGTTADINQILSTPTLPTYQLSLLSHNRLRYVVVDARRRANNNTVGYAFSVRRAGAVPDALLPPGVATKFDNLTAPRLFDSGDIDIYDLQGRL